MRSSTTSGRGAAQTERRNALAAEHAGLVRSIARQLKRSLPPSFELDDLIQEGMIALLDAAGSYDPEAHGGAPFSAYARMVVRGAMLDSVSGRHWKNATMASTEAPCKTFCPDHDDTLELTRHGFAVWPDYEDTLDKSRLSSDVRQAIAALDEPARRILTSYYAEGGTFTRAGASIGIDRRRAGEIHAAALAEVRETLTA